MALSGPICGKAVTAAGSPAAEPDAWGSQVSCLGVALDGFDVPARSLGLPDAYRRNISIWNGESSVSDPSSAGTSLVLPWYHYGTTMVP